MKINSGNKIQTFAGTSVEIPYANENICFGQRQGWCQSLATWRIVGTHIMLHFCDECKNNDKKIFQGNEYKWTKLKKRPVIN